MVYSSYSWQFLLKLELINSYFSKIFNTAFGKLNLHYTLYITASIKKVKVILRQKYVFETEEPICDNLLIFLSLTFSAA